MLSSMRLGGPENHRVEPCLIRNDHHPAIATSIALLSGLSRAIRHLKEQF